MGSDLEKPVSRLHRKSFGVTNRIWLLLSFVLFIVVFSRYVAPQSETLSAVSARHRLIWKGGSDLKPKNFLNVTDDEPSPFDFCPVFGPGDDLASKYGSLTLSKTRLHLGSNARVQRVIQKALLGLPVTFSVVGGSGKQPTFFFIETSPRVLETFVLPLLLWCTALGCNNTLTQSRSFRMSWRWGRPLIKQLLSFALPPVVEQRLPPSRV